MKEFIEVPASKHSLFMRKANFAVGLNDASYNINSVVNGVKTTCPYFTVWNGMLMRCYSTDFHTKHPTYSNCEVEPSWLVFSNFRRWMETQDWKDKALDKDILVKGNKVYSATTCVFIPLALNNLFLLNAKKRGKYKLGVTWDSFSKSFKTQIAIDGKNLHLGRFKTEEEAHQTYLLAKINYIHSIANKSENFSIREALLHHARELQYEN